MKRLWIVVVALGVMAATAYGGAPLWVEHEIDSRMRAMTPGSTVTWDAVDWSWGRTVEISGLRIEAGELRVALDVLRADVRVLDFWEQEVAASFEGRARLEVPSAVRVARSWDVQGHVSTATGKGTFLIQPAEPDPTLPSRDEVKSRRWTAEVSSINGSLRLPVHGSRPGLEAMIRDGRLAVDDDAGFAEARAPSMALRAVANEAPEIAIDGFSVDVRPAEPQFGDALSDANGRPAADRQTGGGVSKREKLHQLLTWIEDLRIRATGGDLRIERGSSTLLGDDLAVGKVGRNIGARAEVFDGTVGFGVEFSPAAAWPRRATVTATDLELHELPARWFPTRSVAGKMSAEAVGVLSPLSSATRPAAFGAFRVTLEDVSVVSDGLVLGTVPLSDIGLSADWSWQPSLQRVRVTEGKLQYGDIALEAGGGWRASPGGPVVDASLAADRTKCQVLLEALPRRLLGPYGDAVIEGAARPRFSVTYPLGDPETLTIDLEGFPGNCRVDALRAARRAWPAIQSAASPDDVKWLNTPFVLPVDEGVSSDAEVQVGPGLASYVPLEAIPDYVGGAAYLSEEVNFYDDGAWNVHLIQRALRMNFSDGRFVYGGSTVTQQLVKNLFLTRDKTIARKVQEALIAWRMQEVVSKERVLELYLNCIEYGQDLYGIGPAARRYFNRPASELTVLQAVFLATIKPAPWYGDQFYERGRTPERGWWPERIEEITRRLHKHDYISRAQLEAAKPFVVTFPTAESVDVDAE
jgi:hypothetical protein